MDLSAFYVDVSKDRLYTLAAGSAERRSAQTAMYTIADGLTRLLAPILPVTTDDLWSHLPGQREDSVHLTEFPTGCQTLVDQDLLTRWQRLLGVREAVNVVLEQLRTEKTVGTSLEAAVTIRASGATADLVERYRDDLPMLCIVSEVTVTPAADLPTDADAARTAGAQFVEPGGAAVITARRASGVKCERCWRYVAAVSATEPAGLCPRCVDALSETMAHVS